MNSFLLTISGVLFLLTCGLSMPTKLLWPIPLNIIDSLREDVTCNDNVVLFVPSQENQEKNLSAAAKCFQNQLETIPDKCTVKSDRLSTVLHAKQTLKVMVQEDVKCIFDNNETASYSSFLEKVESLIQRYNS